MFNNNQGPYLNEQALPMHPVGSGKPGKLSRTEKKALKAARKNGTLIGGEYIAPVAPREELFMGHQTINEIQKPGLATGYGIPEHGRAGSPLGLAGQGSPSRFQNLGSPSHMQYNATSLGSQQYTTGSSYTTTGTQQYTSGSPRVIYESAMPSTSTYQTSQPLGGTICSDQ